MKISHEAKLVVKVRLRVRYIVDNGGDGNDARGYPTFHYGNRSLLTAIARCVRFIHE